MSTSSKQVQMQTVNALDAKFWKDFSLKYWEKKPLKVENAKNSILDVSSQEVFAMLVEYCDQCRKAKTVSGIKLFVEGQRQYDEDVLQILPCKKDQTFLGFHNRMNAIFTDYCLVCDELLQVAGGHWASLTGFSQDLFKNVGLPNRFAELGLYIGNYRKTPFGVHVDGCGVFSFPLVGTKSFRLWSSDYANKNPALKEAHKYSKYIKGSLKMVAKPGDVTYWPSSSWHIAESDGSFSATWSLGVWVDLPHRDAIADMVKRVIVNKLGPHSQRATTNFKSNRMKNGCVDKLPPLYEQSLKKIILLKKADYKDQMTIEWLVHISKEGFKTTTTTLLNARLKFDSEIKINSESLIYWSALSRRNYFCFAYKGQHISGPFSKNFISLIEDLNLGHVCKATLYLAGLHFENDMIGLRQLAKFGAVVAMSRR